MVLAWITRFINNCGKIKKRGPLITSEIQCQEKFYIKLEQRKVEHSEKFEKSRKRLNLELNCEGIYECRGRIQGIYPIYLPSSSALSEKRINSAQRKTLHGEMASTMASVRSLFWIPVLRKLTKSVIQSYYGCKRFRATRYPNPEQGPLPRDRTERALSFEIVGTDYAGPLYYKSNGKKYLKAYILLFSLVLAEQYILSSCEILLLPSLLKVSRN